jgi:dihydropteroate synthase
MKSFTLRWGAHTLALGKQTAIMGIVNVTPDSFSDGGRFFSPEAAVTQARRLVADGADIIDIGGESTRPFAQSVSAREEMNRVVPVVKALAAAIPVPISIDTTKAEVAEAAAAAGASIINDISALRMDPAIAQVAARRDLPVILMHMQGEPRTMQVNPSYGDVVAEVFDFLDQAMQRAAAAGIDPAKIILDPGIGFGKTVEHNLLLIKNLQKLARLNAPVLVGPSRKAFIRNLLKEPLGHEPRPDDPEVESGTQAAVAAAVMHGAHILRIHNVAHSRAMLRVLEAIGNAGQVADDEPSARKSGQSTH